MLFRMKIQPTQQHDNQPTKFYENLDAIQQKKNQDKMCDIGITIKISLLIWNNVSMIVYGLLLNLHQEKHGIRSG